MPVQPSIAASAAVQGGTIAPEHLSTAGACPVGAQLAVSRQSTTPHGVAVQPGYGPMPPFPGSVGSPAQPIAGGDALAPGSARWAASRSVSSTQLAVNTLRAPLGDAAQVAHGLTRGFGSSVGFPALAVSGQHVSLAGDGQLAQTLSLLDSAARGAAVSGGAVQPAGVARADVSGLGLVVSAPAATVTVSASVVPGTCVSTTTCANAVPGATAVVTMAHTPRVASFQADYSVPLAGPVPSHVDSSLSLASSWPTYAGQSLGYIPQQPLA